MNPPPVLLGFSILWNGTHKVVNPDLQHDAMEWFPGLTKVWCSGLSWLSCLGYRVISKPNLHIKQSYCLPWKCRAHTSEHWPRRTWVRARWGQASEECGMLWVEGYEIARWFAAAENTKLAWDNWIELQPIWPEFKVKSCYSPWFGFQLAHTPTNLYLPQCFLPWIPQKCFCCSREGKQTRRYQFGGKMRIKSMFMVCGRGKGMLHHRKWNDPVV